MMKAGSKWDFVVPTELAYGQRGVPSGGIPPNAILIYELELLDVKPPAAPPPVRGAPVTGTNAPTTGR
jgi:hypothetical protein